MNSESTKDGYFPQEVANSIQTWYRLTDDMCVAYGELLSSAWAFWSVVIAGICSSLRPHAGARVWWRCEELYDFVAGGTSSYKGSKTSFVNSRLQSWGRLCQAFWVTVLSSCIFLFLDV